MSKRTRHLGMLLLAALPTLNSFSQQRSDADWDAEGQVAMAQYHDCARAKHAFEQESSVAQASPVWLDQAARASECAGDLNAAIDFYDRELKKLPDNPRLVQKIGDLRYKQEVQADEVRAQQAASAEFASQQRQQALDAQRQQQQQAVQSANQLAALHGRIDQDMQRLGQSLTENFKYDYTMSDKTGELSTSRITYHEKRTVLNANHCTLSFEEGKGSYPNEKDTTVQIDMGGWGATAHDWSDTRFSTDLGVATMIDLHPATIKAKLIVNGSNAGGFSFVTRNTEVIGLINELGSACAD